MNDSSLIATITEGPLSERHLSYLSISASLFLMVQMTNFGDMVVEHVEQIEAEPRLHIGGVMRRKAAARLANRTELSPWVLISGAPFLLSAGLLSPALSLV